MKKTIVVILVTLLSSVTLSLSSIPKASAATTIYAPPGTSSRVMLAQYSNILGACYTSIGQADQYQIRDQSYINSNHLSPSREIATGTTGFGDGGQGTDDTKMHCDSFSYSTIRSMMNSLGFSGDSLRSVYCSMGKDSSGNDAVDPTKKSTQCASSGDLAISETAIRSIVGNKAPLSAAYGYYIAYSMVTSFCDVTDLGVLSVDIQEGDKTENDFSIALVTESGIENHVFRLGNKNKKLDLWNLNTLSASPDIYSPKCKDVIMDHMGTAEAGYVAAYKTYVDTHKPGTTSSSGEETPGTCEEKYSGEGQTAERTACQDGFANKEDASYCEEKYPAAQYSTQAEKYKTACLYGQSTATGATGTTPSEEVTSTDGGGDGTETCAIDGIGWIICPVMTFLSGVADSAYGIIDNFLEIDSDMLDSAEATYNAWGIFRSLANVMFVIVFMIIIFSQSTSIGISNYGIKRMLPRLILAAIAVNLSFYICQFAVDVSNLLGANLKVLMDNLATEVTAGSVSNGNWENIVSAALVAGAATAVAAGAVVAAGGVTAALVILVPVLLSALMAIIMTFIILIARQAAVILLIVLSPLAFVMYLLPNTEKWFKKWSSAFFVLLVLYPVVALLFGVGKFASAVLGSNGDDIWQIAALGVQVLPLLAVKPVLDGALKGLGTVGTKLQGYSQTASSRTRQKGKEGYAKTDFARSRALRKEGRDQHDRSEFAKSLSASNDPNARGLRRARNFIRRGVTRGVPLGAKGKAGANAVEAFAKEQENADFQKNVQAEALTYSSMPTSKVQESLLSPDGTLNGDLTEAQQAAAIQHIMKSGSFDQRRKIVEATGQMKSQRLKKMVSDGVYSKGDQNIYGNGIGDAIMSDRGVSSSGLRESTLENIRAGNVSGEHISQSQGATQYMIDSVNSTANPTTGEVDLIAADRLRSAASAARSNPSKQPEEAIKAKFDAIDRLHV